MTSSEDVAYGDAEPTEFQQGYIAGMEGSEGAVIFARRVEALKRAIESLRPSAGASSVHGNATVSIGDNHASAESVVERATIFERYLETGK